MKEWKRHLEIAVVLALVFAVLFLGIAAFYVRDAEAQLPYSPWPMFQHDAQHSGRSPYIGPETPKLKWSFTPGHNTHSSPAIGPDGTIYLPSMDGKLYALNPDGTEKWSFATGGPISRSPAIGSDGTIYVGSLDSRLYAINPDGTEKWSFATLDGHGFIQTAPTVAADGTIYVGADCYGTMFYALNPDGTEKWSFDPGGASLFSSPAIGADGTIYLGGHDGLHALSPDGMLKWTFGDGSFASVSPAVGADGTIYVGCHYSLLAINPDGTEKWSFTTGWDLGGSCPAIGTDGTIYVPCLAVGPDGIERWTFTTSDTIFSSVAIGADDTIYVGSVATEGDFEDWRYVDGKLHAINPDGTHKWTFTTGAEYLSSPPAIGADGTIYVGSDKLYAIGREEGVGTWVYGAAIGGGAILIISVFILGKHRWASKGKH